MVVPPGGTARATCNVVVPPGGTNSLHENAARATYTGPKNGPKDSQTDPQSGQRHTQIHPIPNGNADEINGNTIIEHVTTTINTQTPTNDTHTKQTQGRTTTPEYPGTPSSGASLGRSVGDTAIGLTHPAG